MTSPTQRSLAYLKKQGYTAQVTEKWNPYANVRQDLFGFIDIVALEDEPLSGVLAVQTTTTGNVSTRVKKILALPVAKLWLAAGNTIDVHGWSKKGKRGKAKRWELTVKSITVEDF